MIVCMSNAGTVLESKWVKVTVDPCKWMSRFFPVFFPWLSSNCIGTAVSISASTHWASEQMLVLEHFQSFLNRRYATATHEYEQPAPLLFLQWSILNELNSFRNRVAGCGEKTVYRCARYYCVLKRAADGCCWALWKVISQLVSEGC